MKTIGRLTVAIVLFTLIPYGLATLAWVAPDNSPVERKFRIEKGPWSAVFEQRWSFFAPPPLRNDRLYYVFSAPSQGGRTLQFEVLSVILDAKRTRAPFNEPETLLDYIVHGSLEQVFRYLSRKAALEADLRRHIGQVETKGDAGPPVLDANLKLDALQTLERYARTVAEANALPAEYSRVRIVATGEPIPPFADRHRPQPAHGEAELFETTEFARNPA